MCSAPSAPKTPKYEPVDQYQAYKQHARYKDFMAASGTKNFGSDNDVRNFNQWLLQDQFDTEFRDESFMGAFTDLVVEGNLTGSKNIDFKSKQALQFKRKYAQMNEGKYKGWQGAYAYTNFDYSDDSDLQRVYDKQFEIQQEAIRLESTQALEDQFEANQQMQIDAQNAANQAQQDMIDAMNEQAKQNSTDQKEMMEEMMNQPIYQAQQAALPKVQYKPKTPEPMPAAPAPPPTMNISPAPAPELVNTGNQMGIVKQSSTARTRSRQRTRGTASLT